MKYSEFAKVYGELASTTKRLEKIEILSKFLNKLKTNPKLIYLLRGRVLPDYDEKEFGLSGKLMIKAISKASGVGVEKVSKRFNKVGDLGDIAFELMSKKKQSTLFSSTLKVETVFGNLNKLFDIEGKGSVDRKLALVIELLGNASGDEAKYIIRTVLNDLRIGVADAILRDAIVETVFGKDKEMSELVEVAYDKVNDFSLVFETAMKGKKALEKVQVIPGRPMKVLLPIKVTEIDEAFRICADDKGRVAVEHKYDGFRVLINKVGDKVSLFTRRLDEVTKQFPDVVETVKKNVKGKSFILDSEVVGYGLVKGKKTYKPFEAISQRIRRKYDIEKVSSLLPVEINVFDVIYLNGKSEINLPFEKRRKLLEKVVKETPWKIRLSKQIITNDKKKASEFYKNALKIGEEGIMVKRLDAPYRPGRRVGNMVKMKPDSNDLDLVIVGAEYGTGKRAGGLTSFYVACNNVGNGGKKFLEVGKVSSGLKEKESEGTTYKEINNLLKPLIISEKDNVVKVKPKVVVSVKYQNIQKSPRYGSGYALRFPRITHYRPERGVYDIASLKDIKKETKQTHGRTDFLG